MIGRLLLVVLLATILGCDSPSDPVMPVSRKDTKMNAAIERARSSVGRFIAALERPQPGQTEFSVKVRVVDGEEAEHMWLTPVTYDPESGKFSGPLQNEPAYVRNVWLGARLRVPKEEISDWMYIDNGRLVGGETLRVLRDGLNEEERAEFDSTLHFRIE